MALFRQRLYCAITALLVTLSLSLVSSDSSSLSPSTIKRSELNKLLQVLRDDSSSNDGVQIFVVKHPFAEQRKAERAKLAATEKKQEQLRLQKELRAEQRRRHQQRVLEKEQRRVNSMMKVNPAPPEFQRMVRKPRPNTSQTQKEVKQQFHRELNQKLAKPTSSSITPGTTTTTTPIPLQRKSRGFLHSPIVPVVPQVVKVIQPLVKVGYIYTPPPTVGYIYKKPTTTTTTTTTPEPEIEGEVEQEAVAVTPEPPPPQEPEAEVELPAEGPPELDEWDIRDAVPGSPGDDYPVHGRIPRTRFTCEGRLPGYYADLDTRCQVFHRCSDCGDNVRVQMDSFICPNGTQFNQEILSCDWWGNVNCDTASIYYSLNEEVGAMARDGSYVQFSGKRIVSEVRQKKVAPTIIPKEQRRTLPDIYRNFHTHSDHGHGGGWSPDSRAPAAPGAPEAAPGPAAPAEAATPKSPIKFDEFKRPVGGAGSSSSAGDDTIHAALENPDYFNPDTDNTVQRPQPTTTPTPTSFTPAAAVPTVADAGDLFDYDSSVINERKSIDTTEPESDASKLDNDDVDAPTTTSTEAATTTTTEETTSTLKPAKVEFVALQARLNPRESGADAEPESASDKDPSGFIVNRRPLELTDISNQKGESMEVNLPVDITPPKEGEKPGSFTNDFESVIQSDPDYRPLPSSKAPEAPSSVGVVQDTYLPPITSYAPPAKPGETVYVQSGYGSPAPVIKETYLQPQNHYLSPKVYHHAPTYYTQASPPVYISSAPAPAPVQRVVPQFPVVHPAAYVFSQQAAYDSYNPSDSYRPPSYDVGPPTSIEYKSYNTPPATVEYSTYQEEPPTIVKYNSAPATTHFVNPHLTYSPPRDVHADDGSTTHLHASASAFLNAETH